MAVQTTWPAPSHLVEMAAKLPPGEALYYYELNPGRFVVMTPDGQEHILDESGPPHPSESVRVNATMRVVKIDGVTAHVVAFNG